jgi:hypothetical protein
MNVFTSAGSWIGTFGWSGGMSACAVACGGAAALPAGRAAFRPGPGVGGSGLRTMAQMPSPPTMKKLRTAMPWVVSCQPPPAAGAAAAPPVSEPPHSMQNFA